MSKKVDNKAVTPGSTPDAAKVENSINAVKGIVTDLGIEPAVSVETRKSLAVEAVVPAPFLATAIDVASEYESLVGSQFDKAAVAEARAYLEAVQPLRTVVRSLARQIEDEVLRKRAVLGSESRKLYRHFQYLSDTPQAKTIAEPLDRLAKAMKKTSRGTTAQAPSTGSTDPQK